jgi:cytochrome c biogenesis protein CcmG, thiol:disulfide interchange protein DsbE
MIFSLTPRTPTLDTPRKTGWMALPVVAFVMLALLFGVSLRSGDPSKLPSTFLDKPAPAFAFTAIDGLGTLGPPVNGFDQATLAAGAVTVVNFWASWCAPCVDEHPQLITLKGRPGVTLAGVNVKDDPAAARQFLARYGNPFAMIGADRAGRGSIEWGVYGTPETFIVNGRGVIVYKHVGPITADALAKKIIPMIEAARR